MPTLSWLGKEKVINHHLDVPFFVLDKKYSFDTQRNATQRNATLYQENQSNTINNRIIHGDNLTVLKSLLPEFEGKVNCIYIDPPYNTGNEGWVYNDNVNDPRIIKWLGDVVGKEGEDLSRHDKWLCMMYPRLKLLHRLLADDGVIFVSIDRVEFIHLKAILNEIFGETNWVGEIAWKNVTDNNPTNISLEHEYVVCYAKFKSLIPSVWKSTFSDAKTVLLSLERELLDKYSDDIDQLKSVYNEWFKNNKKFLGSLDRYKYIDLGGIYTGSQSVHNPGKEGYRYDVYHPETKRPCKEPLMGYRFPYETMEKLLAEGKILFGADETKLIELKLYVSEYKSKLASIIELDSRIGTNEIKSIFPEDKRPFDYPKPSVFIEDLLGFATDSESLILDSFAGSGTTAHAVLKLNAEDGGNRRFILCEMMDYAESITAERVRRVMEGYGEGNKKVEGLGGSFDFYELGDALFSESGLLNESVGIERIRQYIAYSESIPLDNQLPVENSISPSALGINQQTLWLFHYNKDAITSLDLEFLGTLNLQNISRPSQFVVYADKCVLDDKFMQKHGISFKRIPRDIIRF